MRSTVGFVGLCGEFEGLGILFVLFLCEGGGGVVLSICLFMYFCLNLSDFIKPTSSPSFPLPIKWMINQELNHEAWGGGFKPPILPGILNSQLAHLISQLPPSGPRTQYTNLLLTKLHAMGLLPATTTPLSAVAKLSVSKFARRRLAVVMARTGMVENLQAGVKFVEQGHVRVGTEVSGSSIFQFLSCQLFSVFLSLGLVNAFFLLIFFFSSLFLKQKQPHLPQSLIPLLPSLPPSFLLSLLTYSLTYLHTNPPHLSFCSFRS